MTDPDDKLKRAYRDLAREEPSAALDAAILAKARTRTAARSGFARYAGPVSIAAVLVLGIGVSLRMQLEEPGIETSVPAAQSEYPVPSAEPAAPPAEAPPVLQKAPAAKPAAPQRAEPERLERRDAQRSQANQAVPVPTPPPAPRAFRDEAAPSPRVAPDLATAPAIATAPAPAAPAAAAREAPAVSGLSAAPQAALRAKREMSLDAAGPSQLRKSVVEADPVRELERIARLREGGEHAAADKALEEFRKQHPAFRIPDATWERVRPR